MKKTILNIFIVVVVFASSVIISREFRVQKIPNGSKFSCSNCHVSSLGGGTRNNFGKEVEKHVTPGGTQDFWSEQIASLDSDGDGFTNGVELQDPNGSWRTGQPSPGNSAFVTNPGDPNSHPQATDADEYEIPTSYRLLNNYPNPFNPSTTIAFEIPQPELVSLKIYSMSGELVKSFSEEYLPGGHFEKVWNGKNEFGRDVSSGVYIYRLKAGKFERSARMMLLK